MKDEFDWKKLLVMALFVAAIGGVVSFILGMFVTPLANIAGGILASFIALALLLVMVAKTDIEGYDIVELVALLLATSIIGGVVVLMVPAASAFILVPSGAFTPMGLAWSLVYVGAAIAVRKAINK